ncbi:hypothetical protein BDW72DRAFT_163473, partial [Aspergillus terricola var. indicus]
MLPFSSQKARPISLAGALLGYFLLPPAWVGNNPTWLASWMAAHCSGTKPSLGERNHRCLTRQTQNLFSY